MSAAISYYGYIPRVFLGFSDLGSIKGVDLTFLGISH